MSEKVYNFQRVFNIRRGYGLKKHDGIPYRSVGPVTVEEYESRADRYDTQLKDVVKVNPSKMSTEEKIAALREYRESEYAKLQAAVYKRRGWTKKGVPMKRTLKKLGIDYPEVIAVVEKHM